MTLSEFEQQIEGKIFVEISNPLAVTTFIGDSNESASIRNLADAAGVIVFLKNIHRIYARGGYYGATAELVAKVEELDATIQSMGTPLANLAGLVATNQSNITKLVTLIGASELPEETNNIIARISSIESQISGLTGGTDFPDRVNTLVDNRLDSILNTRISNYLTTNNYVDQDDLDALNQTIGSQITSLVSSLDEKATKSDFNDLVALIGADSLSDQNWGNDSTVVTVVNNLLGTTQQIETRIDGLNNIISGIPKFEIFVVDSIPEIESGSESSIPKININNKLTDVSLSAIYLVPSVSDEQEAIPEGQAVSPEMYTEYILINTNAGKTVNDQPVTPFYKWEKLGRQAFKMGQYYTKEEIQSEVVNVFNDTIDQLITQVLGENVGTISDPILTQLNVVKDSLENAESAITTLQGQMTSVQTSIQYLSNILDENGNFLLTGSDIATSDTDSTSIADSITALQNNKLDKSTISWITITEDISNNN